MFAVVLQSNAQSIESSFANKGYYRTLQSGGAFLHTKGMGAFYRYGWRKSGRVNYIFQTDLLSVRHPKEIKISYQSQQNSRGFFYGKLNSVSFIRGSYGFQKVMYDKEVKRGVRVSYYFMGGPTIALLKPVFLDVDPNSSDDNIQRPFYAQATPTIFNSDSTVYTRAPLLYGAQKSKFRLGLHIKYALNFEYSGDDELIRALETGFTFDVFPREIPIMAKTYNDQFFIGFYVGFQFGKRYLQ